MLEDNVNDILDYNLDMDESSTNHDLACIEQAGQLLKIGYMEYEVAVYAIAFRKDGEIYYYISDYVANIEQKCEALLNENIYFTPIRYFFKRYDLVEKSKEEIKNSFRREVAKKLQEDYPNIFFDAIEALSSSSCENEAYIILKEISQQLDCCFDLNELKLYENLLNMMLYARQLNREGYQLLKHWLHREQERITQEYIDYGSYRRQYYGFAYQKNEGKIKYFIDAVKYKVSARQSELIREGYTVTPILYHLYQRESYEELYPCRKQFELLLQQYTGERYLNLMKILRELPAAVSESLYNQYRNMIEQEGNTQTKEAYKYYGNVWNVKFKF